MSKDNLLQSDQIMAILLYTIKGLGTKKRIRIIYIERNNHNCTRSAAYMHRNIDYTYDAINVKGN